MSELKSVELSAALGGGAGGVNDVKAMTYQETGGKIGGYFDPLHDQRIFDVEFRDLTYYQRLVASGFRPASFILEVMEWRETVAQVADIPVPMKVQCRVNPEPRYGILAGMVKIHNGELTLAVFNHYGKDGMIIGEASYPLSRCHEVRWGQVPAQYFPGGPE